MTINSRNKGAAGEREFAGLIRDHLGVRLVRNLVQSRDGGCDLVVSPDQGGPVADALGMLAIEVKRCSRATESTLKRFWEQATRQANEAGKLPVLAFREDRQSWRVVMPLAHLHSGLSLWDSWEHTAMLSVDGFASIIREDSAASNQGISST
jgi:Holliday junction resolvase